MQALKSKKPRFSSGRGGRGHARKYTLASVAGHTVPTPNVTWPSATKPRRARRGNLTAQVIAFLDEKKGQSFLPRQLAEGLRLAEKRKKTLSTTLSILAKSKRIKKAAKGYASAA